jgi:hypothetical protein
MPNHPRLDRTSLARIGVELQAAHHRSEKEPLTEGQRDLLLQWAVREALEAAQDETLSASEPKHAPRTPVFALDPPQPPQPIETAPRPMILMASRFCSSSTHRSRGAGTRASGRMVDGVRPSGLRWSFSRPTGCRLCGAPTQPSGCSRQASRGQVR